MKKPGSALRQSGFTNREINILVGNGVMFHQVHVKGF